MASGWLLILKQNEERTGNDGRARTVVINNFLVFAETKEIWSASGCMAEIPDNVITGDN